MPPLTVDQEWWISRSWTRGLGLTFSKPLLDIVWLKTLNLALVGRQPNLFRWFWVLYFFYLSFWSRCACVFGRDSSLGFWLLRLVMVVKVLWEFDCWAYMETSSSCYQVVLLFSPFSFILLFSTLSTMWDLGVEEGKMKILRKIKTWQFVDEFDFGKSLSVQLMYVFFLLCGFDSCDPCWVEIISSFD